MKLPDGFLDELRTRTSLAHVAGRKVVWDKRKSNPAKGDFWAPCPFHQEKTPSFHVDDRKGFYHCFGCQAKGDAIGFVKEIENVSFMEAVEMLAQDAGLPMPARDPEARKKADLHGKLIDLHEQAVRFFRLQLKTAAGAEARDYLARRGLDDAALERWEIGLAPPGWQNLGDHLRGKGAENDALLKAGLVKASDKGRAPYDTFRNRIMFPIRDGRGRAIAFGGRALDPADNAKYLNSPETPIFDKSRTLYNQAPAREAAGRGHPLVMVEGYMDVIAMSEAGFPAAVAPLGTAVTEHHLALAWRFADEPIVSLDGDAAGLRAAQKVIDLALPLLEAGKSLRFALMPDGQDPDDLLRSSGPEAVQRVLDEAQPMVRLLWRQATEGGTFDSPERRAALDKTLRTRIGAIRDPSIRQHYGQAIKSLRWELFNPRRRGGGKPGGFGRGAAPDAPRAATRRSALVVAGEAAEVRLRQEVILAALLCAPELCEAFETRIEALEFDDPALADLRDVIVAEAPGGEASVRAAAEARCGTDALEKLFAARHVAVTPCIRRGADRDMIRATVAEELAKLEARRGWEAELAEAAEDIQDRADETVTYRIGQAAQAVGRASRSQNEDKTEYETAPNGARISRNERDAFAALMQTISFEKRR